MLRCEDDSIYTGITTNITRRMKEHFLRGKQCAKYTLNHKAKKLECVFETSTKSLASKLEYYIKKLNKEQKETIITNPSTIKSYLKDRVDFNKYIIPNT